MLEKLDSKQTLRVRAHSSEDLEYPTLRIPIHLLLKNIKEGLGHTVPVWLAFFRDVEAKENVMVWVLIGFIFWSSFRFYSFSMFLHLTKGRVEFMRRPQCKLINKTVHSLTSCFSSMVMHLFFNSLQWILQFLCKIVVICCTCLCSWQTKCSAAKISQDILLSFTLQSQIPTPNPTLQDFHTQISILCLHISFVFLTYWAVLIFCYLFFLSLSPLTECTPGYHGAVQGGRETGMLIKGSLFTGRICSWEDVKKKRHTI